MSAFAIKLYEFGGDGSDDEFFIGDDERLWAWLISANCTDYGVPDEHDGYLIVPAPEGYIFYDQMLVSVESEAALQAAENELHDWTYVSALSPDEDKAEILILSPFRFLNSVKPDKLLVLGLAEERIAEFTV